MIKYALLSFQFIGLLILGLFTENDLTIDNQTPPALAPGEKKEVTITIDKKDLQGFAKLEVFLPPGLIASAGKTEGASFTFNEQKARFVWMSMPTESSFKVTYYLECINSIVAAVEIKGAFSYILENKRVDFSIPLRTVDVNSGTVTASTPAAYNSTTNTAQTTSETTSPSNAETASAASTSNLIASASVVSDDAVGCVRTITQLNSTDFRVDIRVMNNTINGFAKILETVPANCKTEKNQDAGSVVTQDKNSIKFVWFEIPKSSTVDISYTIKCLQAQSELPVITGKMSYVENSTPKEIAINTVGQMMDPVFADSTPVQPKEDPKVVETATPKPDPVTPKPDPIAQNPKPKKVEPKEEAITSVPSPEIGITFKVQILAAHRVVNKMYFPQKHGYDGKYNIENHEGWVKYTTGKYNEYKLARDAREQITRDHTTLPGPFVTAYNDGERITVQEAFLISKQQWFK